MGFIESCAAWSWIINKINVYNKIVTYRKQAGYCQTRFSFEIIQDFNMQIKMLKNQCFTVFINMKSEILRAIRDNDII